MEIRNFADELNKYDQMTNHFYQIVNHHFQYYNQINLALATGNSLRPLYARLSQLALQWDKMSVFIVDEYVGINPLDERSCTIDLIRDFCNHKPLKAVNWFSADNITEELKKYNDLLDQQGIDLCILGIGIDGHVGFNYPPPNLDVNEYYHIVDLTEKQKELHVKNGWFESPIHMPQQVITLSMRGIYRSGTILTCASYVDERPIIEFLKNDQSMKDLPVAVLCEHNNCYVYVS